MFSIIGGDGKEYGPATAEQIRGWIAAGRANLDTQAKAAGTEEWRRLGDFPEFATRASAVPPVRVESADGGTTIELADPGVRFLAWLLDSVFGMIAAAPGVMMIGLSVLVQIVRHPAEAQVEMAPRVALGLAILFLGAVTLFIIQVVLLTTRGQTLGKLIFGIRIVRIEDGAKAGFVRVVLLRWLLPEIIVTFIPFVGGLFFIVDSCFVFRADHRCIHDLLASTKVVKV